MQARDANLTSATTRTSGPALMLIAHRRGGGVHRARLRVRHLAAHGAGLFPVGARRRCWCCSASTSWRTGLRSNEKIEGGWSLRALIVLPLSLVLFGLLMEHAGFVPALMVLIVGSAAAGSEFKLVEVAAARGRADRVRGGAVHLWARPALSAVRGLVTRAMELFHNLIFGFGVALSLAEPALLPDRRLGRHADRRAAGHRPARHHRDAAADHLQRRRRSAR